MEARLMEILPPLTPGQSFGDSADTGPDADAIDLSQPLPEEFAFTPVPRQTRRISGLNPHKQRAFIAHLAASGSVTMAARATGHTASPWYQLRRAPGAEQFAAAWDRAVESGARRVLDLLTEHAIHGTPETISQNGEVVLERRRYNHRAMQWIVAHRFPDQFGEATGLDGHNGLSAGLKRLKAKWRKEWEEEQAAKAARPETPDERYRRERREDEVVIEAMTRVMLRRIAELDGKPAKPYKTIEGLTEAEIAALDDATEQRLNSAQDNAEDDV
jgi:hypothetical protein